MSTPREIAWIDGVNSVVMGWFELQRNPNLIFVHCDLGDSVDEDSHRFINDVEIWYGKPIIRIKSAEFNTIDDVFEKRKYLSGINGAPCTGAMKVVPRMNFQLPSDIHFWGYTADRLDTNRFLNMQKSHPLLKQRAPLIDLGLRKEDTHEILAMFGIRRPYVYDIGMPNGNCIGCVKSTSPNYWALIRLFFPVVFARRCEQARRFGVRLVIIRREKQADGKMKNIRIFPDEIPDNWSFVMGKRGNGGCGFHCPTEAAS